MHYRNNVQTCANVTGDLTMADIFDKSLLQHQNALQNIGAIDRTARIIIGIAFISVCFVVEITSANVWLMLFPLFGIVTVPIVDGRDFSLNVIQYLFHGQTRDSHSRHQAGGSTPEIMADEINFGSPLDPLKRFLLIADMRITFWTWKNVSRVSVIFYCGFHLSDNRQRWCC